MRLAHGLELTLTTLLAVAAAATIPLTAGVWGWSWDALNHHIYLGLISESPRWDLDVVAASVQTWQYPYLYWPVYRLTLLPLDGATAGALWASFLCVLMVPPIWLLSFRLLPQAASAPQAVFERVAAVALAFSSVLVLSALGTTANDPLACVPLLWALALMAVDHPSERRAAVAAALWGIATAFKLSNALTLPLLLVWWWRRPGWPLPLTRGLRIATASVAGFTFTYLPWGWQLWQQTGNPFYPFFGRFFQT